MPSSNTVCSISTEVNSDKNFRKNKEKALEAFKESSDVFKKNFKQAVKLMVNDIWKEKNKSALQQYTGEGKSQRFGTGAYFYDSYEGQQYCDQEKKRLKTIAHGMTFDNIVSGRSSKYGSRPKATDIQNLDNRSLVRQNKPKVACKLSVQCLQTEN